MSSPVTYNNIRRLVADVTSESGVKRRREYSMRLKEQLSDEYVLKKLVAEATPGGSNWPEEDSVAARKCRALSGLWVSVFQAVINMVRTNASNSKVKLVMEDVKLPLDLLAAYEKAVGIMKDPSVAIPLLSKKSVRSILKYILDFLAMDETGPVHLDLLKALERLCDGEEFVGFFQYHDDFERIVSELLHFLDPGVEAKNINLFQEAAKALHSLIKTTRALGIQMHLFANGILTIITNYYSIFLRDADRSLGSQHDIHTYLYSTVANIIYQHPDYCLAPMKHFGAKLLRHVGKIYPHADSVVKEALNRFLLSYLYLSQYAGILQGTVAGHMGDLGKSSLVPRTLGYLLAHIMEDISKSNGETENISGSLKAQTHSGHVFRPIKERQRLRLELAARLLAASQQEFLCKAQWDGIEDVTVALASSLKVPGSRPDEWVDQDFIQPHACRPSNFIESPWVKFILLPLAGQMDWQTFATKHAAFDGGFSESPVAFGPCDRLSPRSSSGDCIFPILDHIVKDSMGDTTRKWMTTLTMIGACAELFPSGVCWSSDFYDGLEVLLPDDPIAEEAVICPRCTTDDLSVLVFLLAAFLDQQGGPAGDKQIQLQILASLCGLAEVTHLFYGHTLEKRNFSLLKLAWCWQLVWKTLFRSDLQYTDHTKDSSRSSTGEFVLALMRKIIQFKCTDPMLLKPNAPFDNISSFVYRSQDQIWSLPAFLSAADVASVELFQLTGWLCHNFGLSDSVVDQIDRSSSRFFGDAASQGLDFASHSQSRRRRLLFFSLAVIERRLDDINDQTRILVRAATLAAVTLIQGKMPFFLLHWSPLSRYSPEGPMQEAKRRIRNVEWKDSCMRTLWRSRPRGSASGCSFPIFGDPVSLMASMYRERIACEMFSNAPRSMDFVPELEAADLNRIACNWAKDRFSLCRRQLIDSDFATRDFWSPERVLGLKILFSFELGGNVNASDSSFLGDVGRLLVSCIIEMPQNPDARWALFVFTDLLFVAEALLEALSAGPVEIGRTHFDHAADACRRMLTEYTERLSEGGSVAVVKANVVDDARQAKDALFEDSEDDVASGYTAKAKPSQTKSSRTFIGTEQSSSDEDSSQRTRRKRKGSPRVASSKRARVSDSDRCRCMLQDVQCSVTVARLLLAMEPSVLNCAIVCRALLGADYDLDPKDLKGDVDLRAAEASLSALASPMAVLHGLASKRLSSSDDTSKDSIIALLYKVLDLVRVNMVQSSAPALLGYDEVASIFCVKAGTWRPSFQTKDLSLLINCLLYSHDMGNKPSFRAARLRAAIRSFVGTPDDFRRLWDKHFPLIVKSSLTDSDFNVRRLSRVALSAALSLMDETKVLNAVSKLIPPISAALEANERMKGFENWCKESGCLQTNDDDLADTLSADSFEVMESESLLCRAVIASSVKDAELFLDFVFELAMIPLSRPDLEFSAFQALTKVAYAREYGSIEAMIDSESPGLLFRWAKSRHIGLPLLVTAPKTLRRKIVAMGAHSWNGDEVDEDALGHDASLTFLRQHRHLIIPFCMFDCASNVPPLTMEKMDRAAAVTLLLDNNTFCWIASSLSGVDDPDEREAEEAIASLLRKSAADIRAFCHIMKQSIEESHNIAADRALALLVSVLTVEEIKIHSTKKIHVITRRIIDLSALSVVLPTLLPRTDLPYMNAVSAAIEDAVAHSNSHGDSLRKLGINTIGSLIRSFARLERTLTPIQQLANFRPIVLQAKLISAQNRDISQKYASMAFCIHLLTELVLKPKLDSLRPNVLVLLQEQLEECMADADSRADFRTEVAPSIKRLVAATYHVHESCQNDLLEHQRELEKHTRQTFCQSHGLYLWRGGSRSPSSQVWGWGPGSDALPNRPSNPPILALSSIPGEIQRTLTGTFDILKWVFSHSNEVLPDSLAFVPITPPFRIPTADVESLKAINESFAIQILAVQHTNSQGRPSVASLVNELSSRVRSRESWTALDREMEGKGQAMSSARLNIDQKIILGLLVHIEHDLYNETNAAAVDHDALLGSLSLICGGSGPKELKVVASKCLAKMNATVIFDYFKANSLVPDSWSMCLPEGEDPSFFCHTTTLIALVGCLKSACAIVAQVAFETLEALLSTENGRRALVVKTPSSDLPRSQLSLISSIFKKKHSSVILSKTELNAVFRRAGMVEESRTHIHWCWDNRLWLGFERGRLTFEEWVCALTTGIIVSCTVTRKEDHVIQRDDNGDFFWLCQRMCSLDHHIASKMFPFLVLYLLDTSDEETNYNSFLTDSFSKILKLDLIGPANAEESDSCRKAKLLIVDTVDLLRRVSQARFSSREHKRNVMRINGRESQKVQGQPSEYNAGIPDCPSWQGAPYGVIMRLNGLMVAEACIQLRRHASALFFLELFMNARFRKVGELFDEFSGASTDRVFSRTRTNEISGSSQETATPLVPEEEEDCILRIMALASSSYKFMGEDDALEAVKVQSSAIEFHSFGWNIRQASQGHRDAAGVLRSLNAESYLQTRREMVLVADSMEALELHTLLRSFIDGILSDSSSIHSMRRVEAETLVEKWHESNLRGMLWDSLASHRLSGVPIVRSQVDVAVTPTAITSLQRSLGMPLGGFYGALAGALDFFRNDDLESCRSYLREGRINVISEINRFGGLESSVAGMAAVVEKLRTLEFFEEILVLDGNCTKERRRKFDSTMALMLHRLEQTRSCTEPDGMDTALSCGWLKEVCLSAAYSKACLSCAPGRHDLFNVLTSHVCISAVRARELGRPFVAAEAVQRLHGLLSQSATLGEMHDDDFRGHILLLRLEESKILESQGDFKGAIKKSQQIADQLLGKEVVEGPLSRELQHILTDSQLCCGTWLTKYKLRQANSVLEGFLKPAASRAQQLLEASRNGDEDMARYADKTVRANLAIGQIVSGLYKALVARVQSHEWQTSSSTKHLRSELRRCEPLLHDADATRKRTKKNSKQYDAVTKKWEELYIFCEHLRKDLQRTEEERQNVIDSMHQYLRLAVESYATALSLASSSTTDDLFRAVSHVMSLWFESIRWEEQNDEGINILMQRAFGMIPTFRLVPFSNQLFSRIEKTVEPSTRSDSFQTVLQNLVCHMCSDHPYHCLLPLLALANGTKVGSGVSGRFAKDFLENVGNSKVDPAKDIISRLKKEAAPYVTELLDGYSRLSDAYIDLAGADTSSFQRSMTKNISFSTISSGTSTPLDKSLGRHNARGSYSPAIFTAPPILQPTAKYHDSDGCLVGGERIMGFKSTFDITETGLHRPKIVVCHGSNGGEYRQLVKGEDEIRQDAIMSQVFQVVNSLLARLRPGSDRKTGPRSLNHQLRMATYNVVPLSPASGVLEWVENTIAFGDIIVGKATKGGDVGLHAKYYPKEWNYLLCRKHFAGAPPNLKRETFEIVCRHFSACFRFFFVEQFGHDMMKWHAARMRYTRSVAVSSMVGHILGIGDRHTSNILVHSHTGEIVHIDFGIVFEQGKLLHTPELVPFRLTRNMVDGMGPCGTEGTFVRSSEETMRVLRANASTLLTILSAVVADPLYKWSVSPVEGMRRQKMGSDEDGSSNPLDIPVDGRNERTATSDDDKNEMGKKAIAKINDKLQGYEESTSGEQQGIEGQVQLLINAARDVDNLSPMYAGWGPYI